MGCGVSSVAMTISHRRHSVCPAPPSRSGQPGNRGWREAVALQGTALAGAGYGAAGSVQRTDERDYHYGATPQGLLALRLIFGDRAMIDLTGREYYVSSLLASNGEKKIY